MSHLPTLKTLSNQIDWLSFKRERVRTPPEPLSAPYRLVRKKWGGVLQKQVRMFGWKILLYAAVLIRDLKLALLRSFCAKINNRNYRTYRKSALFLSPVSLSDVFGDAEF